MNQYENIYMYIDLVKNKKEKSPVCWNYFRFDRSWERQAQVKF